MTTTQTTEIERRGQAVLDASTARVASGLAAALELDRAEHAERVRAADERRESF